MANTYEQEMYNYFTQLNDDEKKSLIQMLKTFLKGRARNSGRISIEQYNNELEKAEQQIESGDFVKQEDLENDMETG